MKIITSKGLIISPHKLAATQLFESLFQRNIFLCLEDQRSIDIITKKSVDSVTINSGYKFDINSPINYTKVITLQEVSSSGEAKAVILDYYQIDRF